MSPQKYHRYHEKLETLPQAFEEAAGNQKAISAARAFLDGYRGKSCVVIGYGGSFSVAHFVVRVLRDQFDISARAAEPYDLYLNGPVPGEGVVLVSRTDNDQDILHAQERALADGVRFMLIVTARMSSGKGNKLSARAEKAGCSACLTLEVEGGPAEYEGFVGVQWVLAALGTILALDPGLQSQLEDAPRSWCEDVCEKARELADSPDIQEMTACTHLVGLATGWSLPGLIDFESKFVEAGLGWIEICESKSYTHGRFMNTFAQSGTRLVSFATADQGEIDILEWLNGKLSPADHPIVEVRAGSVGKLGGVELFIYMLHLIRAFADARGVNPSRPAKSGTLTEAERKLKQELRGGKGLYP